MFSIYFYCFNINKYFPDIENTIKNFTSFADEVICATLSYQTEDCQILHNLESKYPNFKVVETDISLNDNRFDGKLKTAALQQCTQPLRIIADADEIFPLSNKLKWIWLGETLLEEKEFDGVMIPVIDLWGDETKIRKNSNIGEKFRFHKDTIKFRDVIPSAELDNGLFRTDMSDSTEPLRKDKSFGTFVKMYDNSFLNPVNSHILKSFPYVIHAGYLDLNRRANIGKEFWKPKWEERSGHKENVVTDINILQSEEVINHNLPLE